VNSHKFSATLDHLHEMIQWISEKLSSLDPHILSKITLASEEAIVNVIHHAYANRGGDLEIQIELVPGKQLQITFIDEGISFDPLSLKEHSPPSSLEEQKIGGLGISLMRKCVDQLLYHKIENRNLLTLIKKITNSPP
jgi:anti-sigma regulatory factor (Ser/Thr protein kinase)